MGNDFSTTSSADGGGIDSKTLVLQAADIVQVVAGTVALKKRGRIFRGLCPFHNEKTPSFNVDAEKGFFKCFGCGAAGNVIDFVMKRDRVEFIDAIRLLAEQYNIELRRGGSSRESAGLRQRLLDVHSAATSVYQQNLRHPAVGAAAREYLTNRGFNDETITRCKLGLAVDAWDGLLASPLMRKYDRDLMLTAGLVKVRENGGGHYDTFRHRLIFPIADESGKIIAFGGRVLSGNDSPAKYLNSPETPIFSKSRICFGLDMARQRVVETKVVAVVEGYTDVIMAHQFGATNVISVLGTALTEQHVNLLRRFADRVVLLFDADAAGEGAVDRALQLFLAQPIEFAIATLPGGVDPDEYLLQNGVEAFDHLLASAPDALSFQWKQLHKKLVATEDDLTGRSKAIEEYLSRLAAARGDGPVDPIRWGAILARVSKFTQIPIEDLSHRFRTRRPRSAGRSAAGKPVSVSPRRVPLPQSASSPTAAGHSERPSHSTSPHPSSTENPDGSPVEDGEAERTTVDSISHARRQAERWVLGGLLLCPDAWERVQDALNWQDFSTTEVGHLAERYWDYQRHEGEASFDQILGILEQEADKATLIDLIEDDNVKRQPERAIDDGLKYIVGEQESAARRKLLSTLKRNADGEPDELAEISVLRRFSEAARLRSARSVT